MIYLCLKCGKFHDTVQDMKHCDHVKEVAKVEDTKEVKKPKAKAE